ncbi:MAG: 1-deoxy-D-xylulose-5-phosphate synthase [Lachnospiraceae bacterium]|nr:1-deoxy-D-xylulose-5-phosphate synthase [Lachnospiraceae bacterium]
MEELLDRINQPNDIKNIDPSDYKKLAWEIRRFIVKNVSRTGGHLSSNLGVVELSMALHLCCELPYDEIIWDVGHQSYTHKILTGRKEEFATLRQYGGMSGFPKRAESPCDVFNTGHSSTSISAATGLAKARNIRNGVQKIFAVIGDGALSGGMAYEALNNAARLKSNLIIVLNDNQMSIAKNVGGMAGYLGNIRTNTNYMGLKEDIENILKKMPHVGEKITTSIRGFKDVLKRVFIPGMLFEDMGIKYIGPIDGHDIKKMMAAFDGASKVKGAVLVHVCTRKGKGYPPAEKDPSSFHGVAPFFVRDGSARKSAEAKETYTDVFSQKIVELAEENKKITAVTAAMPAGTGLSAFARKFPGRFFDVGIAEEHAVTFAAGMAAGGLHPVVAIYSTFLQRAYDQILHDVCLCRLPVVFMADRAGIVGSDGETHQGIFDIAFMMPMPGLTIIAPKNSWELREMLSFAINYNAPVAIRYPRGEAYTGLESFKQPIVNGRGEWIAKGQDIVLLAAGSMVKTAAEARERLKKEGLDISVVNMRFLKPFDTGLLEEALKGHSLFVTLEEGVVTGGFGQAVANWVNNRDNSVKVLCIGLPDKFLEHGSASILKEKYGISADKVAERVLEAYEEEKGKA